MPAISETSSMTIYLGLSLIRDMLDNAFDNDSSSVELYTNKFNEAAQVLREAQIISETKADLLTKIKALDKTVNSISHLIEEYRGMMPDAIADYVAQVMNLVSGYRNFSLGYYQLGQGDKSQDVLTQLTNYALGLELIEKSIDEIENVFVTMPLKGIEEIQEWCFYILKAITLVDAEFSYSQLNSQKRLLLTSATNILQKIDQILKAKNELTVSKRKASNFKNTDQIEENGESQASFWQESELINLPEENEGFEFRIKRPSLEEIEKSITMMDSWKERFDDEEMYQTLVFLETMDNDSSS